MLIIIIMVCALIGTVILIPICGALTPASPPPAIPIVPPAIIQEENSSMQNDDIKNSMKNGIIEKSIEIMRRHGVGDEEIKAKMIQSFSLDDETIESLMR